VSARVRATAARRGSARCRRAGLAAAFLGPLLTVATARAVTACHARALARRAAGTVAAYLPLVAPAGRRGAPYALGQLLIRARALDGLLEGTPHVEVYHGTAPLIGAVGRPLTPEALAGLRRERATLWDHGAALAPLFDRAGWAVVGAVRVPAPALSATALDVLLYGLLGVTLAVAGGSALLLGRRRLGPRLVGWAGAAALGVGVAAYLEVRAAARARTDRWLQDARALLEEAARRPGRAGTTWAAPLLSGADLVAGPRRSRAIVRRRLGGRALAAAAVRLRGGRWAELRVRAAEAGTWGWLPGLIALALLGPAGIWAAAHARE
jgi:hypothetical protein